MDAYVPILSLLCRGLTSVDSVQDKIKLWVNLTMPKYASLTSR
jgi:hypothetical protein